MNIQKYLENQEQIKSLQKENSDYLNSINEEVLRSYPFCVGDIITDNITSITITYLKFEINNNKEIIYQASGNSKNGFDIIFISKETLKIGECTHEIIVNGKQVNKYFMQ